MKAKMPLMVLLWIPLICLAISCESADDRSLRVKEWESSKTGKREKEFESIKDLGGDVLYFPLRSDSFTNALVRWRIENKEKKRVVSVVGDGTDSYGSNRGFYVIIEELN